MEFGGNNQDDADWNVDDPLENAPLNERDDNSFEDSERFEEDSLCSWLSSESLNNQSQTWRGWSGHISAQKAERLCPPIAREDEGANSPIPGPSNRLSVISGRHSAASSTATLVSQSNAKHRPGTTRNRTPMSLSGFAARECARRLSHDMLLDNYEALYHKNREDLHNGARINPLLERIPNEYFLPVIECCFPESEDDIRLYSCLANGNADEFARGEMLYQADAVHELAQIGFHLSAVVVSTFSVYDNAGQIGIKKERTRVNVSAKVDRCRIIQVSCNCNAKSQWCQHVVALCLHRIHRPKTVKYRVTLSESVSDLSSSQCRKLIQNFMCMLPHQYIPVCQNLIDQLNDPRSEINSHVSDPDPTDGGRGEVAIWALDQHVLHENIRRLIVKFCIPSPHVHCDVNLLSSTQPAIASEWQSYLRTFRGREPEGLWNLLSIIREMYNRRDENATTLLHIITEVCLACRQVLMWWYMTKLLQTGRWTLLSSLKGTGILNNQHNAQFNCAELCDEIVRLWRLAALNPRLSSVERVQLAALLQLYHRNACERMWAVLESSSQVTEGQAQSGATGLLLSQIVDEKGARLSVENARFSRQYFPGFFDALEACQVSWKDIYIDGVDCGDRQFVGAIQRALSIDVDIADLNIMGAPSPNMPFLRSKHATLKAFDPPLYEDRELRQELPYKRLSVLGAQPETSRTRRRKVKKLSKRRCQEQSGNSSARGASASEAYLPEFFDTRSLRHAAREAARKAARLHEQQQEESTESGQESDFAVSNTQSSSQPVEGAPGPSGSSFGTAQVQSHPLTTSQSGCGFPQEDVDLLLASAHATLEGLELKAARCEALKTHGYRRQARERALELVVALVTHPPDLAAPASLLQQVILHNQKLMEDRQKAQSSMEDRGWEVKKKRRYVGGCLTSAPDLPIPGVSPLIADGRLLSISERTVKTMERALFLAKTLVSDKSVKSTIFSFVLFVLEMPKAPMASRYLQVKQYYLESELLAVLRSIEIGQDELDLLREFAGRLTWQASKAIVAPVALAHYLLDVLSYRHNMFPQGLNSGPSTSKNIGRQPGDDDLALHAALEALGAHQYFGDDDAPMLNESVRRQKGDLTIALLVRNKDDVEKLGLILDRVLDPVVHKMYKSHSSNAVYFVEQDPSYRKHCNKGQRPVFPYKVDEVAVAGAPSIVSRSASCHSAESASGSLPSSEGQSADDEMDQLGQRMNVLSTSGVVDVYRGATSESAESNSPIQQPTCSRPVDPADASIHYVGQSCLRKKRHIVALGSFQPKATEASAHFFHELAKRVLQEAGGTQSTFMFAAPQGNNQQPGPHRKLHVASFLIGVYALGLNNMVNPTWPTRTYSNLVSWIHGQTLEIGVAALEIIRDTWPNHFTAMEVAAIADKASQSRDPAVIQQAAHLALSILPHSHLLGATESSRALQQCREQSPKLLEQACMAVEKASEQGDGVYPDVLFLVAKLWAELHNEIEGAHHQQQQGSLVQPPSNQWAPPNPGYGGQARYMGYDDSQLLQQPLAAGPVFPGPFGLSHAPQHTPPSTPYYQHGGQQQRPQSLFVQPAPPHQQYSGQASLGVSEEPTMPHIHQSHSAPNLQGQHNVRMAQGPSGARTTPQPNMKHVQPVTSGSGVECRLQRLKNAHRIGIRAMETMGRRNQDDTRNYAKFQKTAEFCDDIEWLLSISKQLEPIYVLTLFECAARVVASPFLLIKLTYESMKLFPPYSGCVYPPMPLAARPPPQPQNYKCMASSHSQIRVSMMQYGYHGASAELMVAAVEQFYAAVTMKLNFTRITTSDTEELCSLVEEAKQGMTIIPTIGKTVFDEFIRYIKSNSNMKKKRDMIQEVMKIVNPGGEGQGQHQSSRRHQHHNSNMMSHMHAQSMPSSLHGVPVSASLDYDYSNGEVSMDQHGSDDGKRGQHNSQQPPQQFSMAQQQQMVFPQYMQGGMGHQPRVTLSGQQQPPPHFGNHGGQHSTPPPLHHMGAPQGVQSLSRMSGPPPSGGQAYQQ